MIIQADILQWAAAYDGPLFHALLCDPPYHLTEITKRFSGENAAPAQFGTDGAFSRLSKGFMGKNWDGGDIAFRPETWAALGRLLHPGAFIMAFAGTRGYHRMATAIEDAGFILHPVICWNFASGFPKATRISTQVDRAAGVTPTVIGTRKHAPKWAAAELGYREKDNGYNSKTRESFDVTAPATELAQAWDGHRYGLQSLKPAIELICVAQKPYQGKPVESITRTGAGAIWVDGGRIGSAEIEQHGRNSDQFGFASPEESGRSWVGRWPANLILGHAPTCNGTCAPGCPVAALGAQSGESESKRSERGTVEIFDELYKRAPSWHGESSERGHDDSGTAARFFFNADYALDRLEQNDPLIYVPKASTTEREAGLYGFDEHAHHVYGDETPEGAAARGRTPRGGFSEATINDGREKSIDNPYQRGETMRRNIHPTVKPIALMRHLATLLLPPELYAPRRLLVPFAGVGSEMIGAMLAGWEDVQGIELEAEHVEIARARIAFWQQMKYKLMNPDTPVKVTINRAPDGQADMFEGEAA